LREDKSVRETLMRLLEPTVAALGFESSSIAAAMMRKE
jgi:hypothetical protein